MGFNVSESWPVELTKKWQVTADAGDATPALVGERLYVFTRQGANEVIMCLDAGSGKELYQYTNEAQVVSDTASCHPGPRSSPFVVKGKVVTLGVASVLSCLDAISGEVFWSNEEYSGKVPQFFTDMSSIFLDGMVIAYLGKKDNGAIIAFDLNTGKQHGSIRSSTEISGSFLVQVQFCLPFPIILN